MHLDLYLTGYRSIPTIGWLFLIQVATAFLMAAATLLVGTRVVVLGACLFPLTTLGGYILSLWTGLFGFHEVRTVAGIVAGAIEIAAFLLLGRYLAWWTPEIPSETGDTRGISARFATESFGARARAAIAPLGFLAVLVLVLTEVSISPAAGSTSTSTAPTRPSGPSVRVVISNFAFTPAHVIARPGEEIVVTNKDGVDHTFTAMPGTKPAATFNTGPFDDGQTRTVDAPLTPGTYHFYCAIHPFMTGELIVEPSG